MVAASGFATVTAPAPPNTRRLHAAGTSSVTERAAPFANSTNADGALTGAASPATPLCDQFAASDQLPPSGPIHTKLSA